MLHQVLLQVFCSHSRVFHNLPSRKSACSRRQLPFSFPSRQPADAERSEADFTHLGAELVLSRRRAHRPP
ncbi:hypothetical protein AMELA_G00213630, partial [Ameiurus melas]